MTEQWQELKETITEIRDSNGTLTQQEVCKFLANHMDILEKQMQQLTDAKETIIKSALKYLVKMQIEEGSVGFAVDNDHDHDVCWDDVLAWLEAQPSEDCISREAVNVLIDELARAISDERCYISRGRSTATIMRDILHLPSVIPQFTDEEIDKAQAVEQAYVDKMVELAVEEAKRPKGKWLHIYKSDIACECSVCHIQMPITEYYHYCPNCGAEMGGGDEDV